MGNRKTLAAAAIIAYVACRPAPVVTPPPEDIAGTESQTPEPVAVEPPAPADADPNDPDPVLTADTLATLMTLRYSAAEPPNDVSNAFSDNAAARMFGQRLFFDPRLSGRLLDPDNNGSVTTLGMRGEPGKVSCAGCHLPDSNFVDARSPHPEISLGAGWTRRRTPTLLDVAYMPLYNWDGQRDTLWNQAMGVFENSHELNSSRLFVAKQIFALHRAEYESIFGPMPDLSASATYPDLTPQETGCDATTLQATCRGKPGDGADYDGMSDDAKRAVTTIAVNVGKALAAYLRQLRCGESRFDHWLDGEAGALSRAEQRGAALFVGKAQCQSCHSGPRLSDGAFHNVGLRPGIVAVAFIDSGDRGFAEGFELAANDPLGSAGEFSDGDRGVLPATLTPQMEGSFRTPLLRCLDGQRSFMHTGQLNSLRSVVRFFNRGGDPAGFPGTNEIQPLGLDDREQADLVAFMQSLQGPGADAQLRLPPPTR